ncbi:MAG: hypothetical protein ACJ8C4_08895 [Gemmataceae bacterium]
MNTRWLALAVLGMAGMVRGDEPAKPLPYVRGCESAKVNPPKENSNVGYELKVGLYQGDPFGDPENGTLKILSEPTLMTLGDQTASLKIEEQVTFEGGAISSDRCGYTIKFTPQAADQGKVRIALDAKLSLFGSGAYATTYRGLEMTKLCTPNRLYKVKFSDADGLVTWIEFQVKPVSLVQERPGAGGLPTKVQ